MITNVATYQVATLLKRNSLTATTDGAYQVTIHVLVIDRRCWGARLASCDSIDTNMYIIHSHIYLISHAYIPLNYFKLCE